ncbi:MAG: hypothetical protein WA294_06000 [Acidobacteriaceae bacterium]
MCLSADPSNRRERLLLTLGSLCLAVSLGSRSMNLTFGLHPDALDFLRGLLLGVSIAFNFQAVLLRKRRNRRAAAA